MSRTLSLQAIVFDMDGTLFDSRTVVPDSYIAAIEEMGGPTYRRDEIVAAYSVGPPKVMLGHLLGRPSADDEVDLYLTRLGQAAASVEVYPGMRETLTRLHDLLPLAVYSGASTRACRILLEACGLDGFFRLILGADEVEHPKPAPDGIVETCRRLGVDVHATAYVGDAPYDLEAARSSGALAVAAGWGHMFGAGLRADLVLERPEDLLRLTSLAE